jgi:leucyl aminopeptidase
MVFSDDLDDRPHDLDWDVLESRGFEAKAGQAMIVSGPGRPTAVVGAGARDAVDTATVRRIGAGLARAAHRVKRASISGLTDLPDTVDRSDAAQALAEGLVLGAYGFTTLKSDPKPSSLTSVAVVATGGKKAQAALDRGVAIAGGACLARDLVNRPGGELTPAVLARAAASMAKAAGLQVKVMDLAAIKRAKLGGVLGVNRGSTQQPRFVEITYQPKGRRTGFLALVGKGITFDAGGLSIKTGQGMMTMKSDMAGAAAVIGAMSALPAVAPSTKVVAYLPMTDNMLGGDASRPGDVLTIKNGKTVEVLNTDAEGRLILADALSVASAAKPDAIVDLATLTGACMVALGKKVAGLMGNDDGWIDQVRDAADAAGESVWPLPLPAEYRKDLDSSVADLKNIGGSWGGALTAGLFLQEFVADGIPWVHIDIAGPSFSDTEAGATPKGGTGFGVRTLVQLASTFEKPSG